MPSKSEDTALEPLRARLDEEEAAYAEVLEALDRLAAFSLPSETAPEVRERLVQLNGLWGAPERPAGGGLGGVLRQRAWDAVTPALERQTEFNTTLVQLLNAHLTPLEALHARLRELAGAVVHYAQRVQPLVDSRDRVASALATTRSELVLETFDRRLESQGRRLQDLVARADRSEESLRALQVQSEQSLRALQDQSEQSLRALQDQSEQSLRTLQDQSELLESLSQRLQGLLALRDRLDTMTEEVHALREALATPPPPAVAEAAERAADDSVYTAFENRFRGSREEIRRRVGEYVELFRELAPVVDLGCGRGEFLEALGAADISARGVDTNNNAVILCRERGLDVAQGDLVEFLREQPTASLGGVFAAQVAEHLPPASLNALLAESHRILRPGGLLLLETVNPRSVVGLLEVFNRDLTHERPLHPDTLSFLAAAAGFTDVRTELRSPMPASDRLKPVPGEGLPERTASILNENVERLNALVYGPLEYVLFARR